MPGQLVMSVNDDKEVTGSRRVWEKGLTASYVFLFLGTQLTCSSACHNSDYFSRSSS